jgi:uncharacterized protein (DUF433 family)
MIKNEDLTMVLEVKAEPAPIHINSEGTAYVTNSRVTLETIVFAFQNGDSAEQIADSYDVVSLADIYAVIAYYLNHQDEVDTYIKERQKQAQSLFETLNTQHPHINELRNKLLRAKQERLKND